MTSTRELAEVRMQLVQVDGNGALDAHVLNALAEGAFTVGGANRLRAGYSSGNAGAA
jgi:hypothetical protein